MPRASIDQTITVGGVTFRSAQSITDESATTQELTATKAQAGSLTTRTGNTEGEITLSTGHGIITGQLVDLYWTGGSRRGCTVGTVNVNAVPITASGSGDNLPSQSSAISVAPTTVSTIDFDAEDLDMIVALNTGSGQLVFRDSLDAELLKVDLTANTAWLWTLDSGFTNPLANDSSSVTGIASIVVSTSAVDADKAFKLGLLRNSI